MSLILQEARDDDRGGREKTEDGRPKKMEDG